MELETAARICKEPEIVTARCQLLCAFHCAPTHSAGGIFIMCLSACPRKKRSDSRAVIQEMKEGGDGDVEIQLCHLVAALEGISLGPLMLQVHPSAQSFSLPGS